LALEKTIREMIKEELDSQLEEIREQVSGVSSRIDALEKEMNEKWTLVLNLRKHTLDQLMLEYRNLRGEPFQESQDLSDDEI